MSTLDLDRVTIDCVGDTWRVWIPPSEPEHYDTDGWSHLGPYGDTYFDTFGEAAEFLVNILPDLLAHGYLPIYLPDGNGLDRKDADE